MLICYDMSCARFYKKAQVRQNEIAMGRVHLGMGAVSYLISAVWAASLIVGLILALQGQQMIPSYFRDAKTLFPIWPVIDPLPLGRSKPAIVSPTSNGTVAEMQSAHWLVPPI